MAEPPKHEHEEGIIQAIVFFNSCSGSIRLGRKSAHLSYYLCTES